MDYLLNGFPYFPGTTIFGTGLFDNGTAAAPSISFASQTNKGFWSRGSNQIGIALAGTDALVFTSNGPALSGTNSNNISFPTTGAVAINAGGTNQNITLTPSGTGYVDVINDVSGSLFSRVTNTNVGTTFVAAMQMKTGASANVWQWFARNGAMFAGLSGVADFIQVQSTGRFMLGTGGTDSGALLQIGTNTTTAAGGMVFGTDQFLYRASNSQMRLIGPTTNVGLWIQQSDGATGIFLSCTSGVAAVQTTAAGQSLELKSGAQVTALTLDASQNATFAGTVKPQLATTAGAPAYVKGAIYFDTTLNKLRVGGAAAWETITSV